MNRAYYADSISAFLHTSADRIVGLLTVSIRIKGIRFRRFDGVQSGKLRQAGNTPPSHLGRRSRW